MELILGKSSVKGNFLAQWTKYVPAILAYANRSVKKSVSCHVHEVDIQGQSRLWSHRKPIIMYSHYSSIKNVHTLWRY